MFGFNPGDIGLGMSVPSHLFVGIVSTEKGRISSMQPKNCIAVSLFIGQGCRT